MMAVTNHSSLNKSEIDFLEENLENCSVENQYFLDYFDGKRDEFEDMLERFLFISSTCFEKKQFLLFLADFFLYQFGEDLVET